MAGSPRGTGHVEPAWVLVSPLVWCYLVERRIIECGDELCFGRRSVGLAYAQCPFFLLSWCEAVSEGGPCHA